MNAEKDFIVWFNGRLTPLSEVRLSPLTHALHYGIAVFEGIRSYAGEDGGGFIFRLPEHIERLFYSAQALELSIPFSQEQIAEAVVKIVRINKDHDIYIRPLIYLASETATFFPEERRAHIAILPWKWARGGKELVSITISPLRRVDPQTTDIHAKISGHYVNSFLARLDALKRGYDDALLLDNQGYVAEASIQNLFLVQEGVVLTPTLRSILPGITRRTVMEILADEKATVVETDITSEMLKGADEVFLVGTGAGIQAVGSIDGESVKDGGNGPLTARLRMFYQAIIRGEVTRYRHWLTKV